MPWGRVHRLTIRLMDSALDRESFILYQAARFSSNPAQPPSTVQRRVLAASTTERASRTHQLQYAPNWTCAPLSHDPSLRFCVRDIFCTWISPRLADDWFGCDSA